MVTAHYAAVSPVALEPTPTGLLWPGGSLQAACRQKLIPTLNLLCSGLLWFSFSFSFSTLLYWNLTSLIRPLREFPKNCISSCLLILHSAQHECPHEMGILGLKDNYFRLIQGAGSNVMALEYTNFLFLWPSLVAACRQLAGRSLFPLWICSGSLSLSLSLLYSTALELDLNYSAASRVSSLLCNATENAGRQAGRHVR